MHRTHNLALHPDVPAIRGLTAGPPERLGLHKLTVSAVASGPGSASQSGRKDQRLRLVVINPVTWLDIVHRDDPSLVMNGETVFVGAAEGSR